MFTYIKYVNMIYMLIANKQKSEFQNLKQWILAYSVAQGFITQPWTLRQSQSDMSEIKASIYSLGSVQKNL